MFELRLLRKLDWLLLGAVLLLCGLGLLAIYSASRSGLLAQGQPPTYLLQRQAAWMGIGLVALAALLYPDYTLLRRWQRPLYLLVCLLLVAVMRGGQASSGAMRWIALGPLTLQPSELAKLAVIVVLAGLLPREGQPAPLPGGRLLRSGLYVLLPFLLVFRQPDLGTALVLLAIWGAMAFLAGARPAHLAAVALGGLLVFGLAWHQGVIKDYQKDRLRVFMDPEADPLGAGYHVIQSKIAIGSGRLAGKGWLHGTQSQLRFIPEQHTDFVFTVIGEELGLWGAGLVLGLYLVVLWRMLRAAEAASDAFGALLAAGGAAMFAFQGLVNVGMTMSIMPVTGIPLPFLSYGGSSLLANMMAIGLLVGIGMRRHKISF